MEALETLIRDATQAFATFQNDISGRLAGPSMDKLDYQRPYRDNKIERIHSLESAGTDESDPQDTIEARLISTHRTATQYWLALVVLSLKLTDNEELLLLFSLG
ncbi:hypothetical protein GCK72_011211 [Caenorhabditis remanei]|uniref:Uncharacterized protein n=1 Tax=Caenorhabditis remanei TaxID=31234 RepID=A0A6A5H7V5_CAERE|nr:hypothetical protein GCK72_011211 [Caenorhabditis remanei]KAF1762946.1 hypothetical protein GCK72_011211 [Caenorhabditis remanei]